MNNYIGQIILVAGFFAPKGFLTCDGQLLAISTNQALFSLLGTTYGGDGITTFALPDLRGRVAVNLGQGPQTSNIQLGQVYGTETVTLTENQLPGHVHATASSIPISVKVNGSDDEEAKTPTGKYLRKTPEVNTYALSTNSVMGTSPATTTMTPGGTGMPYSNLQPTLTMIYCIATTGYFPSRP